MIELGLDEKAVLVAGAGQGIGRACVLGLVESGARVACMDVDEGRRRAIVEEVQSIGGEALPIDADLLARDDVSRAVAETVDVFGSIDAAIDIVGVARWNRALELTEDDWDASFDLVLRHWFFLSQAAGRQMVEQGTGGALVAIASVSGLFAAPLHAAYGAAKAGLMALTKTLAVELAAERIRVNAVAPGAVRTPRVLAQLSHEREAQSARSIPLGRMAEPEDIARAAIFFVSDLAAYVTGQTLVVDGGASVKFPLSLGG